MTSGLSLQEWISIVKLYHCSDGEKYQLILQWFVE